MTVDTIIRDKLIAISGEPNHQYVGEACDKFVKTYKDYRAPVYAECVPEMLDELCQDIKSAIQALHPIIIKPKFNVDDIEEYASFSSVGLSFSSVFRWLKLGGKISRKAWTDIKYISLYEDKGIDVVHNDGVERFSKALTIENIIADDWYVVEGINIKEYNYD